MHAKASSYDILLYTIKYYISMSDNKMENNFNINYISIKNEISVQEKISCGCFDYKKQIVIVFNL